MKNLKKLLLIALAAGLALTGCGGGESTEATEASETTEASEAGESGGNGEAIVYTVIELPNDSGEMGKGTQSLIDEMNIALEPFNASMEYQSADDYSVVAEAMITGTADLCTSSGATYVTARMENEAIQPLMTEAPEGDLEQAGYTAYLGVNSNYAGDFEGLTETKDILDNFIDKPFSFVSATSTSGRVVPTTTFWEVYGPDGTGDVENKSDIFESTYGEGGIFSEVQFAGSHPASVELIANDRVYGGAFCCEYADGYEDQITVVYQQQVPGDPFWYNSDTMDEEHVQAILDHFTQLTPENATAENLFGPEGVEVSDEGEYAIAYGDRFIEVEPDYYNFIEEMFADEE